MILLTDKLAQIANIHIGEGNHSSLEQGACTMELVSYVAGERWSDKPACACPVLSAFMRSWNDSLPNDSERDRLLKPLIAQLVDSKSTPEVEERRSYLALDWVVRVFTPKFLDLLPALSAHAKALRDHEEIADMAGAVAASKLTAAARDAAWAAAGAAAGDAAGDAARDAAGEAARAAAGDAAWAAAGAAAWAAAWEAARAAAWAAAMDAAGDAAGDATWDAAWEFLKPTVAWLQISALDLMDRMLAVTPYVAMGKAS